MTRTGKEEVDSSPKSKFLKLPARVTDKYMNLFLLHLSILQWVLRLPKAKILIQQLATEGRNMKVCNSSTTLVYSSAIANAIPTRQDGNIYDFSDTCRERNKSFLSTYNTRKLNVQT